MSRMGGEGDRAAVRGPQPESARPTVAVRVRPHASRVRPSLAPLEQSVRRWSSGFILPFAALFGWFGVWAWDGGRGDRSVAWALLGIAGALLVCFLGARRFPVIAFGFVLALHVVVAPLWIGVAYPFGVVGTGLFPYLAYRGFHAAHELRRARRLAPAKAKNSES